MKKPASKFIIVILALGGLFATPAIAQQISKFDRDRAQMMLKEISDDVRKHYYDPKYHGTDWDAKVRDASQNIDHAPALNMAFSSIAGALDSLNDSHVFFVPPQRPYRIDFGYQTEMIGDRCYILRVRPGSDAEAKGLKPGDEILAINGFTANRESLWKMDYVFRLLRPMESMVLSVGRPSGLVKDVKVESKVVPLTKVVDLTGGDGGIELWNMVRESQSEGHLMRARFIELNENVMVLKFPEFEFTEKEVEDMIGKARKNSALIIDLRENGGGSIDTLEYLISNLFDHDVKVGDVVERDKTRPWVVKSKGHGAYSGKLIVLVDSKSASASELFARVVQLEKRGVVLGDQTSGSVMRAREYSYHIGVDTVVFFGASITDANVIMTDGRSLEHTGVTPDEILLPTPEDLAANRDPLMVHAVDTAGTKINEENAGSMFPYEWPKVD